MKNYIYLQNSERQEFSGLFVGEFVIFSLFFTVLSLLIAFFLPVKDSKEVKNVITNVSQAEEENSLINFEPELEFDRQSIKFANTVEKQSSSLDKGLEFYRDARTKAAVEWFYLHVTENRDVTQAILQEANKNDIPLSLAFSLAYVESRYKASAVNDKNSNQSIDRGLFQLNNKSFPKLSEKDFFDPAISAKFGMQHLRFCLDVGGKEVTALAMYNAGTVRVKKNNTPTSTLNYVDQIMRYKSSLDSAFAEEVVALYNPTSVSSTKVALK